MLFSGYVLTVSETGYGRLSEIDDYRLQSRGGMGLINYHTDKYGNVAAIKVVDLDDDVIVIADNGTIIRFNASNIRICSRPSKGVMVMKLADGSKIVTIARSPHEDTDDSDDNNVESIETTENGLSEEVSQEFSTENQNDVENLNESEE